MRDYWKAARINNIKKDISKSKIAVYTSILGEYDELMDPLYIDKECKYICFTNNKKVHSDIWEIRDLPGGGV